MTKEQLAEIRGRVEKATPIPWEQLIWEKKYISHQINNGAFICAIKSNNDDAKFIAHARQDVPALLDEVERLQSEKEDLYRLSPKEEWDEDYGDVLWWILPICSPPYCGTPNDFGWHEGYTHWSKLPVPDDSSISK